MSEHSRSGTIRWTPGMNDEDEAAFYDELREVMLTSPDGFVHVIHCDVTSCRSKQGFPGPEEDREAFAFAEGWVEDDEGLGACPDCVEAGRTPTRG